MRQLLLQSLGRLGRQLGFVLVLPVLLLAVLLLAANTGSGQRLLVWGLGEITGGQVVLSGLGGRLPEAPRLQRLELRDPDGTWLVMEDAALDLEPWRLLRGEIAVTDLSVRTLVLHRLPQGGGDGTGPVRLPLRIRLDRVTIADLVLDPAFPGAPRLAIEGRAALGSDGGSAGGGAGTLEAKIEARAADRPDRYRLDLALGPDAYRLDLDLQETAGGLLPALAGPLGWRLPEELGAWRLTAQALGPPGALALTASLEAGTLQASAEGLLDLDSRSATRLQLAAQVPAMAMAPAGGPQVGWRALVLEGDLSGPWDAPQGQARLELEGLASGDLALDRLTLTAVGDRQSLRLAGELQGLEAPALPESALPESARRVPLRLTGEVALGDPARPFSLDLDHPLLTLAAEGEIRPASAQARLGLPDLAALASLVGLTLAGSAQVDLAVNLDGVPRAQADGALRLTQAPGPLVELLGPEARLALAGRQEGDAWRLDSAEIEGAGIKLAAQGSATRDRLALGWTLGLSDLGALAAGWSGSIEARGGISGPPEAPDLVADLSGQGAHGALAAGRIQGSLGARLGEPAATLDLAGDWSGQPLRLDLTAGRSAAGGLQLTLSEGRWASVVASGQLNLAPGSPLPQGELRLQADRLADLAPLLALSAPTLGNGLDGRLTARLKLEGDSARIDALGDGLTLPGSVPVGALALDAQVRDPWGAADIQGQLRATGLALGTTAGDLMLVARGPLRDLGLTAESALATAAGPTRLGLDGRLDIAARRLALQRLEAQAADQSLRLLAPAVLDLADGVAVDRLRLGLGTGSIELAGRLVPPLDLNAKLSQLPLELASLAAPDLPLTGTLAGEVRLSGPLETLVGSVRLEAAGLRLTRGAGRGLPPAEVSVAATLGPTATQIDASAQAGANTRLRLRGTLGGRLPFAPGTLDLRADGRVDLALLDPLLTAAGRQASGQAVLDARLTGTLAAPSLSGSLLLTDGALWDRGIGLVLTQVQGRLALAGDELRLEGLSARAGPGTLALAGKVGVLVPGIPVDLRLTAKEASPLQLDRLKLQGNADLRLTGEALGRLNLAGRIQLSRVEVRLPERLPANVVTLEVREVGQRRAGDPQGSAASPWEPDLGLDLVLAVPRDLMLRGRGVDAELGGEVRLQGTLADPLISGGFDLVRGEYDLVGQTLRFSRGRLGFDGAAGLNPSLDLEARVSAGGSTAILAVQGTAQAPRIELRGEPEMPQDEVLSRLLFGVAGRRLSPWQAARVGVAAASLAGIEVGDFKLLERLRGGLGLSRLGVGTDERGDTSVEGGRQLSERVYLGARQGTRAGEPQGVLRIEVSPRIQLEADVGPIGGTRAGAAFEIEY